MSSLLLLDQVERVEETAVRPLGTVAEPHERAIQALRTELDDLGGSMRDIRGVNSAIARTLTELMVQRATFRISCALQILGGGAAEEILSAWEARFGGVL